MFDNLPVLFDRIIQVIWAFLNSHIAFDELQNTIQSMFPADAPYTGFIQCVGALISLVVPIKHIGIMIGLKLPVLFLASILSLVYRSKSFIPTMGD